MKIDHHFAIGLTYLRTLIDMFFIVQIATRFFTAYIDPGSIMLGKGELVTDPKRIAYRYIRTNFFIDVAAALPVPQVRILFQRTPQLQLKRVVYV
jgi:cyclic nucleotide gated channel